MPSPRIQRALISVSNKLGLADFARGLASAGVQLYSTGGTARYLADNGVTVIEISDYTGFPEVMDGRLKTLHPKVFGGILCRPDRADDRQVLETHEIVSLELVVVNLYPFEATVAREGVTWAEAIEQIDIGGPSLVRAAAKNHAFVTVATAPEQYAEILDQIQREGVRQPTCDVDWRGPPSLGPPPTIRPSAISFSPQAVRRANVLRNAWRCSCTVARSCGTARTRTRQAAVYGDGTFAGPSLISARQLNGKELSYNNLLDLDSALAIVRAPARCRRGGDQAQQSVRGGLCRHTGRRDRKGARRRSGQRLRFDPRFQPDRRRGDRRGAGDPRVVHRSHRGARLRTGSPGDPYHSAEVARATCA